MDFQDFSTRLHFMGNFIAFAFVAAFLGLMIWVAWDDYREKRP